MWPFRKKEAPLIEDFSDRIRHVAFIMDGNGRWARRRGLPREAGHIRGSENFRRLMQYCRDIRLPYVTVYAFSTENWARPAHEVAGIMKLLDDFMEEELAKMVERDARIVFLGDLSPLSDELREKARHIEELSAEKPFTLQIALNYGGRDEILHACNALLKEGSAPVDAATFAAHLYTKGAPDPDLVVRTGGDQRISNFLLWQSAYAEYYFTKTLWPDLTERELHTALTDFCHRSRRYGGLDSKEQTDTERGPAPHDKGVEP